MSTPTETIDFLVGGRWRSLGSGRLTAELTGTAVTPRGADPAVDRSLDHRGRPHRTPRPASGTVTVHIGRTHLPFVGRVPVALYRLDVVLDCAGRRIEAHWDGPNHQLGPIEAEGSLSRSGERRSEPARVRIDEFERARLTVQLFLKPPD